jgi:hypothetical protein
MMVMVRDPAGAVAMAVDTVNVIAGSQPFTISSPSGWRAGRKNAVRWSHAEIAQAPFNVQAVNVSLFTHGGWQTVLTRVPNNGHADVCVRVDEEGRMRIRVEPVQAAFYGISAEFSVAAAAGQPSCTR